jgi:H+/Cl- antiporter ClcA
LADASSPPTPPSDPAAILRSRQFVAVLVMAAVVGIIVSLLGWGFLELVHQMQGWVFTDLPHGLGLDPTPSWWALPVCTLAGLPVAFAIARLPGQGGHVPAEGLHAGGTEPSAVPGVVIAALATLGLGLVLGPEAPLLAIGGGVAVWCVRTVKRDAPPTLVLVIGAAGAFAAIAVIFGSPLVGAVLIIEATGLGGATLPLILVPGLIAAGIGSLVFIGMADWTGLSSAAYSLQPLHLAPLGTPTWGQIGWAIALGVAAALVTYPVRQLGLRTARLVMTKVWVVVPLAGLVVAALAFAFAHATDKGANLVLFSGEDSLSTVVDKAGSFSVAALLALLLFKGLAWGVSLGSFRGGPTFPAIFLGAAGGVAAAHLPGLPASAAVPVGIGVMTVAYLRLPLSSVIIAIALSASAGRGVDPLVIVGVVAAYIATLAVEGRLGTSRDDSDADDTARAPATA